MTTQALSKTAKTSQDLNLWPTPNGTFFWTSLNIGNHFFHYWRKCVWLDNFLCLDNFFWWFYMVAQKTHLWEGACSILYFLRDSQNSFWVKRDCFLFPLNCPRYWHWSWLTIYLSIGKCPAWLRRPQAAEIHRRHNKSAVQGVVWLYWHPLPAGGVHTGSHGIYQCYACCN